LGKGLIPPEKEKERRAKGGRKGSETKKRQRKIVEIVKEIIMLEVSNKDLADILRQSGVRDEDLTMLTAIVFSLVQRAITDNKAFEILREYIEKAENVTGEKNPMIELTVAELRKLANDRSD
jgi:hypothetical protein